MTAHDKGKGLTALAAAAVLAIAAAASVVGQPKPDDSTAPGHQTTPISSPSSTSMTLDGEHALEYLSQLAREAAHQELEPSERSQQLGGTTRSAPSASQQGEPVGAGGSSGGSRIRSR